MPKPKEGAPLEEYARACRYTVFALESGPETLERMQLAAAQLDRVEALQAELKTADNAVLRARVKLSFRDVRLDAVIRKLAAAARLADTGDRTLQLVSLLFGAKTPSEVIRPSGAGIGRELTDAKNIRKAIELVPAAKADAVIRLLPEFDAAIAGAEEALAEFEKALENRQFVARKVLPLKREARSMFDRIEGQLRDQFPGQRELVSSFFLPADVSGKGEEEDDDEEDAGGGPKKGGTGGGAPEGGPRAPQGTGAQAVNPQDKPASGQAGGTHPATAQQEAPQAPHSGPASGPPGGAAEKGGADSK